MVTNQQIRRLFKMLQKGETLSLAALKAGMDEKTARKYRDLGRLPSELKVEHTWRTREDPFSDVWVEIIKKLDINHGLEAKTIFGYLQRQYPGEFQDGQLRTLQRRIKQWRAIEGPPKEVYFPQEYHPGELSQSDFTSMTSLGITINNQPFDHLIYHFVLPYSNWETGTICYSESFESLSEGLQNAFWELGGVTKSHRTDRLSAAVHNTSNPEEFTRRYQSLLRHYGVEGKKIQAGKPHENGDVEQGHYRFKKAVEQSLILSGGHNFDSLKEYDTFLKELFSQLNSGRKKLFKEELKSLCQLPKLRLESCKRIKVKVSPGSTIRVNHNVYSVHSRLIGEWVDVRLYAEHLEVWYAQRCIESIPRLRGEEKHFIQYRHIIDWLIRKPGAFENYRYRKDMFPTTHFRLAYDLLQKTHPTRYNKEYLKILYMAAKESETIVELAIRHLLETEHTISSEAIEKLVLDGQSLEAIKDVEISPVDITAYDMLLCCEEAVI